MDRCSLDSEGESGKSDCSKKARLAFKITTRGTICSSIFILLTTCIGAGTLSLPYAFAQGGVIFSSAVFLIIMLMSIFVGVMLFEGKRNSEEIDPSKEVWGYEDIAESAFGIVGKIAVLLTITIFLFLALIAYMIYARDQLEAIVSFALSKAGDHAACSPLVNCVILMTFAFFPIFPITLLRDLSPLQFTSYLSIFGVFYIAVVMTVKTSLFLYHHQHFDQRNFSLTNEVQLGPLKFNGVLTVISYCSLAFVCHFNLLPLQRELTPPVTKSRFYSIIFGSIIIAYLLYNLVIFSGYFSFYGSLREDVMLNYPKDDIVITTARVALFFTLLLSYPVLLHPTRASINRVVFHIYDAIKTRKQLKKSPKQSEDQQLLPTSEVVNIGEVRKVPTSIWFCETWILFGFTFLPASTIPNVGYVWNFVGSIGGVLVLYIYPAMCYLRLCYLRHQKKSLEANESILSQYTVWTFIKELIAWIILLVGLILLVVENYQAIYSVIEGIHEPSGQCYLLKCEHTITYYALQ